jgi:hypothetical protein
MRRCPACGAREPTGVTPAPAAAASSPISTGHPWQLVASLLAAALAGAAVTAAVFLMRPAPPPRVIIERVPAPPAPTLEPARAAPAIPPAAPEASRSRGRTDWLFFFKPGDQLMRMGEDTALGMVLRIVPRHTFADGTVGPAYLVQQPDGGQRMMDADELERRGRLQ